MKRFIGRCLAVLICVGLSTGQAAAGDPDCLWQHLSSAAKDRVSAGMKGGRLAGAFQLSLPSTESQDLATICVVPPSGAKAAFKAMIWQGINEISGQELATTYNISPRELKSAWLSMTSSDRLQFEFYAAEVANGRKPSSQQANSAWTPVFLANHVPAVQSYSPTKTGQVDFLRFYLSLAMTEQLAEQF